ncbi:tryptophan 5-hydroxylase 1-like [Tubulanus polymorphus]|uniref:tryptophan 5-hydroxylase 1-like n=1 Tax=Tubulanus polymorphus TaxID=672921 RepID=UPI003DA5AD99
MYGTHNIDQHKNLKEIKKSKMLVSCVFALKNSTRMSEILLALENNVTSELVHVETRQGKSGQRGSDTGRTEAAVFVEFIMSDQPSVQHELNKILEKYDGQNVREDLQDSQTDDVDENERGEARINSIVDLDRTSKKVLMYGAELDADHPGFKDAEYRKRRKYFAKIAFEYKQGEPIPRVEYTEREISTWNAVYSALKSLYPTHACREHIANLKLLEESCGYRIGNIPQLDDVSRFLKSKSGFTLRPVAGYLSSRDFLVGLAFRVFHCTQYIRHHEDPLYTPEPDCCHELLGHMALLADEDFAAFTQEIGLASIGASDDDIKKLANLYVFTVEFGLCKQDDELRVYGAGLLSSAGELKHVLTDKAVRRPFDPLEVTTAPFIITEYQSQYYYTETIEKAKQKLREYTKTIARPFEIEYDPYSQTIRYIDSKPQAVQAIKNVRHKITTLSTSIERLLEYVI